jgi:hypothetical protein
MIIINHFLLCQYLAQRLRNLIAKALIKNDCAVKCLAQGFWVMGYHDCIGRV